MYNDILYVVPGTPDKGSPGNVIEVSVQVKTRTGLRKTIASPIAVKKVMSGAISPDEGRKIHISIDHIMSISVGSTP